MSRAKIEGQVAEHQAFGKILARLAYAIDQIRDRLRPLPADQIAERRRDIQAALGDIKKGAFTTTSAIHRLPEISRALGLSFDQIFVEELSLLEDAIDLRECLPAFSSLGREEATAMLQDLLSREGLEGRLLPAAEGEESSVSTLCRKVLIDQLVTEMLRLLVLLLVDVWLIKVEGTPKNVVLGALLVELATFALSVADSILGYEECISG